MVIDLLRAEHLVELLQQTDTSCLDAEDIIDLVNIVREGASSVHTRKHQQVVKVHTLCIQHILVPRHIPAYRVIVHLFALDRTEVNSAHTINASQHRVKHLVLEETEVSRILNHRLVKGDTENQLLGRCIRCHALHDLELTDIRQLGLDLREVTNIARIHLYVVQLKPHDPRGSALRLVLQAELAVKLQRIPILLHNRAGRQGVGIVVDAYRLCDVPQGCTLDTLHHGNRVVLRDISLEVCGIARTLRVRRG